MTDTAAVPIGAARYAGTRVHRVEDARLLTGHGTFVDDVQVPGVLHAYFVRSPFPRARITSVDVVEAAGLPGVHAVFVASDLNPGMHEQWHGMLGRDSPETSRPPLAEDEVRFVGDPVVMVVAESRYVAEDACDLAVVDYEPLTPVVDYTTAESADQLVHQSHGSNLIGEMAGLPPSALEEVFSSAAHVVSETIYQQAQSASPMETRGIVVAYEGGSGEVTLWAATQAPHELRGFCARLLGIPEHRVRVIARDTGGAFGQKIMVQREEMCTMLAARKLRRPVKWIEDRRENLLAAGQSRHEHAAVAMAFDEDGAIQAAQIDFVQDCGAYPTPWPVGTSVMSAAMFPGAYRVPRASFRCRCIYTNTVGRSAYRGPWAFESVARELLLDKAARQIGIDPVELRRRNVLGQDELPYTSANGFPFDHISPRETFEQALGMLDYEAFRRDQAKARKAGRYLGIGTSTYVEPTVAGSGIFGSEAATIRIEPSGKVLVYVAGGSAGNSLETTAVQLAADALGVHIDDVATIQGDTAVTGYGGTGGSRSGPMIAGAVAETASVLRDRLVRIAAQRLEAAAEDIELVQGRASVRGTPSIGISVAELAQLAYFDPSSLPPGVPAGLEATARYSATAAVSWANATHLCTCEVDVATGQVTLLRYIVSEDCGPMINPNIVEGQIAGGTVQGIAGALYEHLAYDEDGNPVSTTYMDYLVPTAAEVPIIEHGHVVTPGPGPGGYKGVGEGGAIGAPPAVVNAVADALSPFGVSVTRLPLSPAAILALIDGARR